MKNNIYELNYWKNCMEKFDASMQSDVDKIIKEMVVKPKEYFTTDVVAEINKTLKDSGWIFYGKRPEQVQKASSSGFYFAAFGPRWEYAFINTKIEKGVTYHYHVGEDAEIDGDFARLKYRYECEVKKQERYLKWVKNAPKREKEAKKNISKQLQQISKKELVQIIFEHNRNHPRATLILTK
jgi:hypothetical protein